MFLYDVCEKFLRREKGSSFVIQREKLSYRFKRQKRFTTNQVQMIYGFQSKIQLCVFSIDIYYIPRVYKPSRCGLNNLRWRRNLWVGCCVSSWWPLFPSRRSSPLPWASGLPVAIQWQSSVHWNATGERNFLASVLPVVFQWLSSGLPVCSNYAN